VIFVVSEPMFRLRPSSEFINSHGVLNFQDNVIRRKQANEGALLFFFSTNGLGPLASCLEEKQCAETNCHVHLSAWNVLGSLLQEVTFCAYVVTFTIEFLSAGSAEIRYIRS